jgi:hypothetical protein
MRVPGLRISSRPSSEYRTLWVRLFLDASALGPVSAAVDTVNRLSHFLFT